MCRLLVSACIINYNKHGGKERECSRMIYRSFWCCTTTDKRKHILSAASSGVAYGPKRSMWWGMKGTAWQIASKGSHGKLRRRVTHSLDRINSPARVYYNMYLPTIYVYNNITTCIYTQGALLSGAKNYNISHELAKRFTHCREDVQTQLVCTTS